MSQQINLYNPLFRKQEKYFSTATMLQALGLILLGSLLVYGFAWYRTSTLEKQSVQTEKSFQATQMRLAQTSAAFGPRHPSKLLQDEVAQMDGQVKARAQIIKLLNTGELGNTRGFSEYLRALSRQTLSGLWITGFHVTGTGSDMAINGRTLQPELVPVFINHLKKEPALAGKTFSMLEMRLPEGEKTVDGKPAPIPPYIEFSLRKMEAEPAK
ncbi:MAG: fimbrial assembly protein [Pseudomonadota bacterium]